MADLRSREVFNCYTSLYEFLVKIKQLLIHWDRCEFEGKTTKDPFRCIRFLIIITSNEEFLWWCAICTCDQLPHMSRTLGSSEGIIIDDVGFIAVGKNETIEDRNERIDDSWRIRFFVVLTHSRLQRLLHNQPTFHLTTQQGVPTYKGITCAVRCHGLRHILQQRWMP